MLVQVVLFFTNKTILWKQRACWMLCAFMCVADGDGDSIHLPAKCTDCWMVQAAQRAGGKAGCSYAAPTSTAVRPTTRIKKIKRILWKSHLKKGFYKAAPNLLQLFLSDNMSEYTKEAITTLLRVEGNASYPSWLVYLAQSDEFNDM